MAKEKVKDILSIIDDLRKEDNGKIFNGSEAALQDKRIKFDSPRLTYAYGGFKLNAIHRLNGKESGGKTTIATYIAGQCQKRRFEEEGNYNRCHVVIEDYERSFDVIRAQQLGLLLTDPTNPKVPLVHVIRRRYVEDGEAAWEAIVQSDQVCCTIFDSDAAAPNKTELNDEIGKANFGAGAKAVGICIKRKNIYVDEFCTPVIWISQERANQQLMAHLPKPTGGEAVNFYPSTRFRVTPGDPKDYPKKNGEAIGIVIKLKNYKNKTATPFREAQLTMLFNGGIQSEAEYISMATELDVIEQHGGWFYILNPLKDMSAYVRTEDKKALKFLEDSGDLVKCQGADQVALWFQGKHPTPSCNHPDWVVAVKEKVDACLLGYNAILDKTAVAVDEEEEFQKEKAAQKARVEAGEETLKRGKVDEAFDEYERIAEEQKARGEATEVAVEGEDEFNGKIDGPSE